MNTLALTRSKYGLICAGTTLLFVAAQIQVPLQPVPVTLQTMAVMLLGLVFDKRSAVSAVLLYLGLGVAGLPVFAGFSNLALVGPRAGYLIGFLGAVWVVTTLRERFGNPQKFWAFVGLNLLGSTVIYMCGVAWLAASIGPKAAAMVGFVPFILPGLIKAGLLFGIVKFLRS
jgi:biotin transport system substrate-specific component